jgi:hypothetical protein
MILNTLQFRGAPETRGIPDIINPFIRPRFVASLILASLHQMLKAGWSALVLAIAAFCLGMILFAQVSIEGNKYNALLQKPDPLEARLHRDLRASHASLKRLPKLKSSPSLARMKSSKMMEEAFVEMGKDNKMLRHEVEDLQQQSMIMSQVLKAYSQKSIASNQKQALPLKRKVQRLAAIDTPRALHWYNQNHPGGGSLKNTLNGIQENPIDLIDSEDATRDPFDPDRCIQANRSPQNYRFLVSSAKKVLTLLCRHYLRAPMPHDPASSLIKTVTGDYGSPMTYKDIVNNKVMINIVGHIRIKI